MNVANSGRLAVLALLASWLLAASGCSNGRNALVHLTFDKDLRLLNEATLSGPGMASVYLPKGISVVKFDRGGKQAAAVLDVIDGGEIYLTLKSEDLAPILTAEEDR